MNSLGAVNTLLATNGAAPPPAGNDIDGSKSNAAFSGVLDRVAAQTGGTQQSAPNTIANPQISGKRSHDTSGKSETAQDQPGDGPGKATAAAKDQAASPSSATDISALAQAILNGAPAQTGMRPQKTGASAPAIPTTQPVSGAAQAVPAAGTPAGGVTQPVPGPAPLPLSPGDAANQAAGKAPSALPGAASQSEATSQPGTKPADPRSDSQAGSQAAAKANSTSSSAALLENGAATTALPPPVQSGTSAVRPPNAVTTKTPDSAAQLAPTTNIVDAAKAVSSQGSGASGQGSGNDEASKRDASSAATPPVSVSSTTIVSPDPLNGAVSPAQQIVTALQSLRTDMVTASTQSPGSAGASTAAADVGQPQTGTTASVKTLTIELNPANLGPVSITMRMLADSVDIRIAVANPQTLHLLDKDKHLLSAAVEAAGGSRDTLQIGALSDTSGSDNRGLSGQSQQQSSGNRQDGLSSDASSSGGQPPSRQDRPTSSTVLQSESDEQILPSSSRPNRTDGSLYL